jgi:hypothetical protein
MATNLIETVKSFFTPDVVNRASERLGESEDGIRKAVEGGVPAVFAGLLQRSDHGEATSLLSDARQAATHHLPGAADTMFTTNDAATGSGWGTALFGGAFASVSNALASFAGVKTGSANTMLNLLTPLGLSVLGNEAIEENLNAQGLRSLLSSQRGSIMAAFGTIQGHEPLTSERPLRVVPNTIWKVLLVVVVLAFIAYLVMR